jgi:hypothetical protein
VLRAIPLGHESRIAKLIEGALIEADRERAHGLETFLSGQGG